MGGGKPQATKAPFQQQQSQVNTFGLTPSIANTPEARALLDAPLDFGDDIGIDPGVGRRTDLAEQDVRNRWDSAMMGGLPPEYRTLLRDSELRKVRSQGAAEAQQAEYARKQLDNQRRERRTLTELDRRRLMLPGVVQTGGSGTSSGFNTQVTAPQPGFLQSFGSGLGAGLGGALPYI